MLSEYKNFNKVLELGPSLQTVVKKSDIMLKPEKDSWGRPLTKANKEYLHDATSTPWPIKNKEYDVFIALQVWEHLDDKQIEAFKEVIRISKVAILSFPYKWNCPVDNANYPEHHMINEKIIADWTLNKKPKKVIKIPRTGVEVSKGARIIYLWEF